MIAIVDYGVGNIKSITNMLKRAGHPSYIASTPKELTQATKIILPGIGSFDHGMEQLKKLNFIQSLEEQVIENNKPILGICLGAQLFAKESEEGSILGLGWFDATVVRFDLQSMNKKLKIPHMGWNHILPKKESKLLDGLKSNPRFYFVHSYHIKSYHAQDVLAETTYGINFPSILEKKNIIAVQFHPEKSHTYGLTVLKNFASKYE